MSTDPKAEQNAMQEKNRSSNGLLFDTCKHIRYILATQEQMLAMHKQFTAQRISAEAYNEAVRAASVKIQELEEQREELETVATRYAEVKVWLDAFEESTRTGQIMTATDAVIMKTLVEEILVDDYGFEVKFKCGASVEQEYLK